MQTLGAQLTLQPLMVNDVNTNFTLNSIVVALRSLKLDLGSTIVPRLLVNSEHIAVADIREKLDLVIEAEPLATFNPFALAVAATAVPVALTHGTVPGSIISLSVAAAQMGRPGAPVQKDGIVEWPLSLNPTATAAGNQFSLAFT